MSEQSPSTRDPSPLDTGATEAGFGPVRRHERLEAVDVLRGFAVLGILGMNIYAFAMPFQATSNPLLYGGTTGLDWATWVFTHVLFEQKFMTIFSMLFGAGLVLMVGRAEARGVSAGSIYYRRLLWLALMGIAHAYLLWLGDILYLYAVCGLLLYPMRRLSPGRLLAIGLPAMLVVLLFSTAMGFSLKAQRQAAERAETLRATGETLTPAQEAAIEGWDSMRPMFAPTGEDIAREVEVYRDGWWGMVRDRAPWVLMSQTILVLWFGIWRVGGLMLCGMALMKLGVFSCALPARVYRLLVAVGYGVGLPLAGYSAYELARHGFDPIYTMIVGGHVNYVAATFACLGHVGVVMLFVRSGRLPRLRATLAAVGRTALTNYLLQTVILTTVFYGYGLGLYGSVDRFAQMGFVVAVWAVQLVASPLWLRWFRFGPAEWLWRSLTYGRRQPMLHPAPAV